MDYTERLSDHLLQIESSPNLPNGTDRAYLHNQLRRAEEELRTLDEDPEIPEETRSRVVGRINRCRAALAPYSKLPNELIEEIMKFSVLILRLLPSSDGKNDTRLQITQICSSWRSVAFGISAFWDVYLATWPTEGTINLISAWFRQCSSTQISFQMSHFLGIPPTFNSDLLLKQVLVPYAHRIKTLSFLPVEPTHLSPLPWDVLTSLSLHAADSLPAPGERIVAPFLRFLALKYSPSRGPFNLLSFFPEFPLKQLTSLYLTGIINVSHIYQVLPQCPALERCQLYSISSNSVLTPVSLSLPHLKSLSMMFTRKEAFDTLFIFAAPSLSSLSTHYPLNEPGYLSKFIAYLTTLKSSLRQFELTPNSYPSDEVPIEEIMRSTPSVTHFIAKATDILPTVLAKIGTGELLPNIRLLRFSAPDLKAVDAIVDCLITLQPRWRSKLQDIHIHTSRWQYSSRRIRALRSLGININLEYTRDESEAREFQALSGLDGREGFRPAV